MTSTSDSEDETSTEKNIAFRKADIAFTDKSGCFVVEKNAFSRTRKKSYMHAQTFDFELNEFSLDSRFADNCHFFGTSFWRKYTDNKPYGHWQIKDSVNAHKRVQKFTKDRQGRNIDFNIFSKKIVVFPVSFYFPLQGIYYICSPSWI